MFKQIIPIIIAVVLLASCQSNHNQNDKISAASKDSTAHQDIKRSETGYADVNG